MDEFFSEMPRLRDAVDEKQIYDTSSTDHWNTLTSSMDVLEDTHHAISAFIAVATKLGPKHQERELGERYLRAYGVMQALVMQQDAALNLHVSLGMPMPDLKPLDHIRDLRVAAPGTPRCKTGRGNFRDGPTSFLNRRSAMAEWNCLL